MCSNKIARLLVLPYTPFKPSGGNLSIYVINSLFRRPVYSMSHLKVKGKAVLGMEGRRATGRGRYFQDAHAYHPYSLCRRGAEFTNSHGYQTAINYGFTPSPNMNITVGRRDFNRQVRHCGYPTQMAGNSPPGPAGGQVREGRTTRWDDGPAQRGNGRENFDQQACDYQHGNTNRHGNEQNDHHKDSQWGQGFARRGRGFNRNGQSRGFHDRTRWQQDNSGYKPKDLISLSKSLSWVLRHGAEKCKLHFMSGGFLYVEDVLKLPRFRGFTVEDVEGVVATNDKQRFAIKPCPQTGRLMIRANQGHTIEVEDLELTRISLENADSFPTVVHGTYHQHWPSIEVHGLSRRTRNHIHFAPGVSPKDGVISGMRRSCEALIYLDLKAALKDGLEFFVSANNVILSPGDKEGYIKPHYFSQVLDRVHGCRLYPEKAGPKQPYLPVGMVAEPEKGKKKKKKKKKKHDESGEMDESTERENTESENAQGETEEAKPSDGATAETTDSSLWSEMSADSSQEIEMSTESSGDPQMSAHVEQTKSEDSSRRVETKGDNPMELEEAPSLGVREPVVHLVESAEKCQTTVEELRTLVSDEECISVACFTDPSDTSTGLALVCMADRHHNVYVFDVRTAPDMIKVDGPLFDYLQDNKTKKVFEDCGSVWLYEAHSLLMPYMSVIDLKVAYDLAAKKENLERTDSLTLEFMCHQLELDASFSASPSAGRIEDIDWSVRPLTDHMTTVIKNTTLSLLAVYEKLRELIGPERKDLKKATFDRAWEGLNREEVTKLHKQRVTEKAKSTKTEPAALSGKERQSNQGQAKHSKKTKNKKR